MSTNNHTEMLGIADDGNAYPVPKETWVRITVEEKVEAIKFTAEVAKVTTLADGGIRVVLDLGEDGCQVMRVLAECKQNGVALDVRATPSEAK